MVGVCRTEKAADRVRLVLNSDLHIIRSALEALEALDPGEALD